MAAIGTRSLVIYVDDTNVTAEVSAATVSSGETDSDFVSFADAAAGGGREYKLKLTFVQDATTSSLWDQVWSHAGETVAVVLRPYGNTAPSAGQPHFAMNAVITEPDGDLLGGEADASPSARFTTEVEWTLTGKPSKVVA
jgi:hypothetical protein